MEKSRKFAPLGKTATSRLKGRAVMVGLGITVVVAWVFYDSPWALFLAGIWIFLSHRLLCMLEKETRQQENASAFKEMLMLLASYMQAGYSIENALRATERELKQIIGTSSQVFQLLTNMTQKLHMGITVERGFYEFAEQLQLEEALEFADVLYYAKRLGGNYIWNVQKTIEKLQEKMDVEQEIVTMMAEKRLELRVMAAMPIGILAYIKLASSGFIDCLYHNVLGIFVMSTCLGAYVALIYLGRKIVTISV